MSQEANLKLMLSAVAGIIAANEKVSSANSTTLGNLQTELAEVRGLIPSDFYAKAEVDAAIAQAKAAVTGDVAEDGNTLKKLYDKIGALSANDISYSNAETGLTNADGSAATTVEQAIAAVKRANDSKASQADLDNAVSQLGDANTAIEALDNKVDVPTTVSQAITDANLALENKLIGGDNVAETKDTIKELGDLFTQNADFIAALQDLAAGRVAFDRAQDITEAQKSQARSNIGSASQAEVTQLKTDLGDVSVDYKAYFMGEYNAALAAA